MCKTYYILSVHNLSFISCDFRMNLCCLFIKMADWVLCKIYKMEKNPNVNNNVEYQVQNIGINQEEAMEEDEPSSRRRRLSVNQVNNQSGANVQMVASMQSMLVSINNQTYTKFAQGLCRPFLLPACYQVRIQSPCKQN